MNIVILGAGSIGSYLASTLSGEGHDVILIDREYKALERIGLYSDIAIRMGSGTDPQLLEEVKEFSPHFFIAVSSEDETNLTACAIAKNLGYPKTIARIRQRAFLDNCPLDIQRLFCVDHILGTERIIAEDILKCILHPGSLAVENFAHGAVQMRTIVIPENYPDQGKPLAQVHLNDDLLIGLIRRKITGESGTIIFPKGQDLLLPGDEATVVGKLDVMEDLQGIFGLVKKFVRTAVIIGGSGVAIHLAQRLLKHKIKVKIIEQDEGKCAQLAALFPKAIILNHEGTDFAFLKEESVDSADIFIACTSSHETNILAAILGKQAGCCDVIALVSDESAIPLLQRLDISYSLSEKGSIARRIQIILHDETFISWASLYDNQARIMEVKISSHSELIGMPICDLSSALPKNLLIAMIKNENGIIIPKGNHVLNPGDTAIVICGPESIEEMEKMF
ncbi:MAG TPA: Trk system potassium transporter TrkA [Rhabdochlamydiaceae bacterium]|jgi:trk system potassium uptake protein TrkA